MTVRICSILLIAVQRYKENDKCPIVICGDCEIGEKVVALYPE